jgi:hypothetical protein
LRKSWLAIIILFIFVSGCSDGGAAPAAPAAPATPTIIQLTAQSVPPGLKPPTVSASQANAGPEIARPDLASSELVVGPERFVFVLINSKTGRPIKDVPAVGIQFLKVHDDGTATKVSDAEVLYHNQNLPIGMFVARTNFTEPGKWGAIVTIRRLGQDPYQVQMNFDVLAHGAVPMIGGMPPASKNLTQKDDPTLASICSTVPHDDMHSMTIVDAMKSGKPTFILFATPGFCDTQTCGPDMQVAQAIEKKYKDRANFIHIETPSVPQAPQGQLQTVQQWGLKTEPWVYFLDKTGRIAERFEGGLTYEEVEPEFAKLFQ